MCTADSMIKEPTWYGSDNSLNFLQDVLKIDPGEVSRLFALWECTCNQNTSELDTLAVVHSQCVELIQTGLNCLLNNGAVSMNYVNYKTAIVQTHKVRLVNWPTGLKFVNPSFIGTVGDIQTLRNSLRTSKYHWEKLKRLQQMAHKLNLERCQEAGEIVGKPQKQRSDAGTKCKVEEELPQHKEAVEGSGVKVQ
ncbi:hypothetical protein SERLADRAFT_412243 [Serpula lacrymans var. lacrymans S7.9]|uniref:Uncharacterized protein n=1 Tax=Serpula lacrymans var. lacrymans (strain S7.9) TaxID=578457 RepID=F8PEM4_SERL9|nr:uncharacterized protein SERLADRAFT_412243 [Serpula lacrymans var. lacrymans S7.9]EGO18420.1 hypothetical protein SERLADRAFT_412243 [Serpula lacrymans var. lacrymans S7.9]